MEKKQTKKTYKIGLALSGGGAKGFVHMRYKTAFQAFDDFLQKEHKNSFFTKLAHSDNNYSGKRFVIKK